MNRDMILERIDSLVNLCEKTEPDYKDSTILFTGQYVTAQEMHAKLARIILEEDDEMSIRSRDTVVEIMKESNIIYKMRRKMMKWKEEGKDFTAEALQMEAEIEDFLVANQKINAIKAYRTGMKDIFGEEVTLRDSKHHIDTLHEDLKKKGIVSRS